MYLPETISGPTKRSYLKTINNARNGGSTNFVFSGQIGSRRADVAKYMVNAAEPYSHSLIKYLCDGKLVRRVVKEYVAIPFTMYFAISELLS